MDFTGWIAVVPVSSFRSASISFSYVYRHATPGRRSRLQRRKYTGKHSSRQIIKLTASAVTCRLRFSEESADTECSFVACTSRSEELEKLEASEIWAMKISGRKRIAGQEVQELPGEETE